jgi:hypothetical protein
MVNAIFRKQYQAHIKLVLVMGLELPVGLQVIHIINASYEMGEAFLLTYY